MKRFGLVAIVAILGLVVGVPTAASSANPAHARIAKKCKKKHAKRKCKERAPTAVIPPPAPPALTDAEVINRVVQKASEYCNAAGSACLEYGYYSTDPAGQLADCASKSAYSWTCYGYNVRTTPLFVNALTCDFREVVERSGHDGITSHQDLTFGGPPWGAGWDCYA